VQSLFVLFVILKNDIDTFSFSKAMSVLKVEYPDTMDETKTRVKIGGLLDPRLGTIGIALFHCSFANFLF